MAHGTSTAINKALERRKVAVEARLKNVNWFIENVANKVGTAMRDRVKVATTYLHSRVTLNISRPVTKTPMVRQFDTSKSWMGKPTKFGGPKGSRYTKVTDRSTPGEFPKADTTQLLKTLIMDFGQERPGEWVGYIGTPLGYGVILELMMDRSFLVKTLRQEVATLMKILGGPIYIRT